MDLSNRMINNHCFQYKLHYYKKANENHYNIVV